VKFKMKIVIVTENGDMSAFDLDSDAVLETIQLLIEIELHIPPSSQQLYYNGNRLSNTKLTLSQINIKDSDLILVRSSPSSNTTTATLNNNESVSIEQAREFIQSTRNDRSLLHNIEASNRELYEAIQRNDVNAVVTLMSESLNAYKLQKHNEQQKIKQITADPMSSEAQEYFAEQIRMENVARNMEAALEYHPESFGSVVMLFVPAKVNGVEITAFVDSGAQSTIISKQCLERCHLSHLMDTRFKGVARGVGTANILGKVHLSDIQLGSEMFMCSYVVMEDFSYDLLLGLDMLRRHRACIDLELNCLRIHDTKVQFLPEHQIPAAFKSQDIVNGGAASSSKPKAVQQQPAPKIQWSNPKDGVKAAAKQQPTPAATQALPFGVTEEKIARLTEAGFERNQVIQALFSCQGNEEQAASLLLQSQYGF